MGEPIDTRLEGRQLEGGTWSWSEDDVMLYALGVGAEPSRDLALIYEGRGPLVLPSFGSVPTGRWFLPMVRQLGLDLGSVLHGEQLLTLYRPVPPSGTATVTRRVAHVWDKGSGAVVVVEEHVDDGRPLCLSRSSWFIAGAGGFGGQRGPSASSLAPVPDREPDVATRRPVRPEQGALYRLSGDRNPVHIDPAAAAAHGFERVFLHGLCTLGMVTLELVMALCGGEPRGVRDLSARFLAPVHCGDELEIELWREARGDLRMRAAVDGRPVLSGSATET